MTFLLRLLAAAVGIAALTAHVPAAGREPLRQADYYVMRHLQKGEGPDPGLTTEGRFYSDRLAVMLANHRPKAIYVSATRRARETAAAVALRWKVIPKEYNPADTPGLIARVRRETGPVLIVGHSNTVPDFVEALGGERPPALGDAEYNEVWCIARAKGRTTKYTIGTGENINRLPR